MSGAGSRNFTTQPPALPDTISKPGSQSAFLFSLFVAALFIGVILQALEPAWLKNLLSTAQPGMSGTALTLLLALFVSVLVHELGHLLPSLFFGFHVSRIILGPVSITCVHGRWKLQYSRSWFSASVSAVPQDERAWRLRMLIIVAGGPIASLSTFLGAACLLDSVGAAASGIYFLSALAQLNLLLFVLGLIPNSASASVRNDARLFLTLLQNRHEAEQIRLYHLVTRLQIAGARPSAYPMELITRLGSAKGNLDLTLFNALSVFLWSLDSENINLADTWDRYANALVQHHILRLSATVLCESACFDLLHRGLPDSAARKLRATNFETLSPWLKYRARAVLQIAEGDYSDAIVSLDSARASFPAALPYFQFELTILDQLEHRAIIASSRAISAHAA